MGLSGLLSTIERAAEFEQLANALGQARAATAVLPSAAKAWLVSALWDTLRLPLVLLTPRPEGARRLSDQLQAILGEEAPVYLFPEREALPYERLVPDAATFHQRLQALTMLTRGQANGSPPLIVSSLMGASQRTLPRHTFITVSQTVKVGDAVKLEELLASWLRMGYLIEPTVEVPGTISRRGGIVDVYPPGDLLPTRIELWGDQVESIRRFDPASQRSVETVAQVTVTPCSEVLPSLSDRDQVETLIGQMDLASCSRAEAERIQEELALLLQGHPVEELPFYAGFFCTDTLLDYLPDQTLLVVDEPSQLEETAWELEGRTQQLRQAKEERGDLPRGFPLSSAGWGELSQSLESRAHRLVLAQWRYPEQDTYVFPFTEPPRFWGRLDTFTQEIARLLQEGITPVVVTYHDQRLREILDEANVPVRRLAHLQDPPDQHSVTVVHGYLAEGWTLSQDSRSMVILSDNEVFGSAKIRRPAARSGARSSLFLEELVPGSYVVHVDHGVARFAGTTWRAEDDATQREYLVLEYAERDRLYVPTEHLDRVSPYVAAGDRPPTLTRLGTQEWNRIKQRVKESTREMAQELLELYASREVVQGTVFPLDTPWERELEDSFPYVETPDQLLAITEVKQDMQESQPMDRLVCGDVGYGKTEVALRAAFKAVMHGMQVAVLVPTTVLAQQHYATFVQRLSPYPVKVEVLSRFRTRQEQTEVVQGLKEGTVDICIGTHRLLQRDVGFKNLGLVVVDEEQRFGVRHKERMKQMRQEVDILTLSATPIPRTLHMALSGVRDMSAMDTPPEERLPVKTYASEDSSDLMREAILRELDRGGQVFVVHNRVRTIRSVAARIQELVPEARVGIGHGQMPEEQLARVMEEFSRGDLDVLVCTTIIESGLDLPNVNTMLINRADMLGLGQLYQLRGRVGRAGQRAYCYLLVPRGKQLTETAEKRIKTILAATELGSGFRIAMMDLEIRGAGNLLGAEQSGHIHAVGFDLYNRLLAEAVEELGAKKEEGAPTPGGLSATPEAHARVDLPLAAHIPEEYIAHLPTRLSLYRRLMGVSHRQELSPLREELHDRFGALPEEVENLLYLLEVRALADQVGVESVTLDEHYSVLRLKSPVGGARPALEKSLEGLAQVGNAQVRVPWHRQEVVWKGRLLAVLERLIAFQKRVDHLDQLLQASSS